MSSKRIVCVYFFLYFFVILFCAPSFMAAILFVFLLEMFLIQDFRSIPALWWWVDQHVGTSIF